MEKIITSAISIMGANYSPNTGDTPWNIIIIAGLAVVGVGLLIFAGTRKRK